MIHEDQRVSRIILDFIQRVDPTSRLKPEEVTFAVLKGGRSQAALYRLNIRQQAFVLRIFAPQAKEHIRKQQIIMAIQAGEIGVAPKVLFVDVQLEGIISEFIHGRTVTPEDFEDLNRLAVFADLLRNLHQSTEKFPLAYSPFRRFHDFLAKGASHKLHTQLAEVKVVMERLEALLQHSPTAYVPTHLDLNSLNILVKNEQFFLVDWVNGGMSDPYFDLATFAVFHNLNELQTQTFLKYYFRRSLTEEEWNRFLVIQPIRLFVIAAAFLSASLEDNSVKEVSKLPNWADFVRENASNNTSYSQSQIGAIMLNAGIKLIQDNPFQTALKDLQKSLIPFI